MKKNLLSVLLISVMLLCCGCGNSSKTILSLTVPLSIFGITTTQEECDLVAGVESFKSITLNSDNTVTLTMTENRYQYLLKQADEYIKNGLAKTAKEYKYIESVSDDGIGQNFRVLFSGKVSVRDIENFRNDLKYSITYYGKIRQYAVRNVTGMITIDYTDNSGKIIASDSVPF